MIITHAIVKPAGSATATVEHKLLEPSEPIPPGSIWIDLVEPTMEEDQDNHSSYGDKQALKDGREVFGFGVPKRMLCVGRFAASRRHLW